MFEKNDVADEFKAYCFNKGDVETMGVAPLGAAALSALGGVAWDLAVEAVNSKVDKIQEQSSRTWNATWTTNGAMLTSTKCLALVRYRPTVGSDKKVNYDPQMAILLSVKGFTPGKDGLSAVQFAPLLVASKSSAALTKDEGGGKGKIGVSVAGAVSYFDDGELKDTSPDAISVSGIAVEDPVKKPAQMFKAVGRAAKDENGNYEMSGLTLTKPVAFPTTGELYLKFAVVETGTLSGKDAKSKAEIKAVTDALGPIAKDALKKRLGVEDAK
ncbi:hypothetical protein DMW99_11685 [Pseudomonas chlororaphis]|nr:hypothetical protein C1Y36_30130 [Pseudomonas sp. FW306-2-2C-D06C]PYC38177.1 hypothetical protein DMW99_11685 [Pseudomonas chlororaphis]